MHLVDEGSDTVELILVADAVDERHEKTLAIEVAVKLKMLASRVSVVPLNVGRVPTFIMPRFISIDCSIRTRTP